jgi:hypothetical protein
LVTVATTKFRKRLQPWRGANLGFSAFLTKIGYRAKPHLAASFSKLFLRLKKLAVGGCGHKKNGPSHRKKTKTGPQTSSNKLEITL